LPLHSSRLSPGILAVGGHLKNTVAVSVDKNIFISQHIGDLENRESMEAFRKVIESFKNLYRFTPERVAADLHPEYLSSKFARECGLPVIAVQHHYAHIAACMAENELEGRVLGVAWDGTGYGPDGTVWGGEFLLTNRESFDRVASFRRFRLPGGDAAVRQPRRTALGMLFEIMGDAVLERRDLHPVRSFSESEISVIVQMLQKGLHSPWTSSAGRIFDAVASITGLCQQIRFEGQAAMETEFAIGDASTEEAYPFSVGENRTGRAVGQHGGVSPQPCRFTVDWEPLIHALLQDVEDATPPARISLKFHNALAEMIVAVADRVGEARVALSGGCFQNRYLLERSVRRLEQCGFRPYWHQRIPPNDGCIAPGQIAAVSRMLNRKR
jgi:hydrogenase maturation protein HypF